MSKIHWAPLMTIEMENINYIIIKYTRSLMNLFAFFLKRFKKKLDQLLGFY